MYLSLNLQGIFGDSRFIYISIGCKPMLHRIRAAINILSILTVLFPSFA